MKSRNRMFPVGLTVAGGVIVGAIMQPVEIEFMRLVFVVVIVFLIGLLWGIEA